METFAIVLMQLPVASARFAPDLRACVRVHVHRLGERERNRACNGEILVRRNLQTHTVDVQNCETEHGARAQVVAEICSARVVVVYHGVRAHGGRLPFFAKRALAVGLAACERTRTLTIAVCKWLMRRDLYTHCTHWRL